MYNKNLNLNKLDLLTPQDSPLKRMQQYTEGKIGPLQH